MSAHQPNIADALQQALAHHRAGRLAEAESLYRRVLAADPDCADALHLLGIVEHQRGRHEVALTLVSRAAGLNPRAAMYHNSLGLVLHGLGRYAEAAASYRRAVDLQSGYADAMANHGLALAAMGRLEDAAEWYRRALRHSPSHFAAHMNLGNALHALGDLDGAAAAQRQAIQAQGNDPRPHNNLGIVLQELARHEEARSCFRRAMELADDWPAAHSNLLLSLHYDRGDRAGELFDEHLGWARKFAEPLRAMWPGRGRRRSDGRIRVGYVSADFCAHPVGFFIEPLLAGHDRRRFELFCYADVDLPDEFTHRLAGLADRWRPVNGLDDEHVAQLVMEDAIDILVDLGGHTARNRLMVFARKPAPVQVTYLGYPNTTGMSAVDWRLTDARCDPPGAADALHSERLMRLEECFLCYRPPERIAPPGPVPALRAGHVTFGSFNNLAKVTPRILALWARILRAVGGSRLVLKCKGLGSAGARGWIRESLVAEGISDERIELHGPVPSRQAHLRAYDAVDIALDTYPYCGTTTTCEALWMGVPVITLAGPAHVSRVGLSLLWAAGLGPGSSAGLVADGPDEYVALAVRLAADVGFLGGLRAGMRDRLLRSRLCDQPRFVRAVEAAYGRMLAAAD